jgi:hypothetical protein
MNAVQLRKPALTVRQPYASLIIAGLKPIENRTWATTYRGPLLIHAAVKLHDHSVVEIERRYGVKIDSVALQFGGIIGRVELVDVVTSHSSRWFTGPFGWVLTSPVWLPFRSMRGAQTLFEAGQ